ncbi:MAG: redox-sensing transcriptional repressor Rex [Defluviitaleaceae bacterium]|nr:redox-sensing transcriptional repressor Rex [Defluviitaleaceae bacterium]
MAKLRETKVSMAVVRRLPRYFRHLGDLMDKEVERISSEELSARMGVTSSQVRQDLNNFGAFGQQGYGYNVANLYGVISRILGLDLEYHLVLVGAGNAGRALVHHEGFAKRGFSFKAIFDACPSKIGTKLGDITIKNVDELEGYLKANKVDIVGLTVPDEAVEDVLPVLIDSNIRGIWNFCQIDLKVPSRIMVESVLLADSLMTLSYKINEDQIIHRLV